MKFSAKLGKTISLAFWLWAACAAQAHVGSPTVFFQGLAGSFPIRVTIEPPGVVPGLAQIHVVVSSGSATRVTVRPVRWDVGVKGSPAPDTAVLVPGETNLFTAQLWLMASGAYSVFVEVSGPDGEGTAIVPLRKMVMCSLCPPLIRNSAVPRVERFLQKCCPVLAGTGIYR